MYLRIWLKAEFESTSCHLLETASIFSKIQGGSVSTYLATKCMSTFAYGLIRRDFNPSTTHFTNNFAEISRINPPMCFKSFSISHIAAKKTSHYVLTWFSPRCIFFTHLGGTWMSRKLVYKWLVNGLQLQYTPFISRL